MSVKCCRDCVHLGTQNIAQSGRFCYGQPIVGLIRTVVKNEALSTHYCATFKPRVKPSSEVTEKPDKTNKTHLDSHVCLPFIVGDDECCICHKPLKLKTEKGFKH
jgi:hypothetical protein